MFLQDYILDDEKKRMTDMVNISTSVVGHRVGHMLDNQQFKKQTQEVADFINSIINEICDKFSVYFSDPTDSEAEMNDIANEQKRSEDIWYVRFETYLYCEKAKAAGINVSKSEVDALMIAYFEAQREFEDSLVPEG